jgi:hypothetical protein
MISAQFNRLSRVISILINSNTTINPITKMVLYNEINNYTNDIIVQQLKNEEKLKNLENEIARLQNKSIYRESTQNSR